MRNLTQGLFARYGVRALIETAAGEREEKVLFRAAKSTAWQSAQQAFTPLGEIPQGRCICLVPASVRVGVGDTLTVNENAYTVRRVEDVTVFTHTVGQRCLCVQKGA